MDETKRACVANEGRLAGIPTYVVVRAARGPLARALDGFLEGKVREEMVYDDFRAYITKNFVSSNEDERVKYDLEGTRQRRNETVISFNRRYLEATRRAYPESNADNQRTILGIYLQALGDQGLSKRIIQKRTTTLGRARSPRRKRPVTICYGR